MFEIATTDGVVSSTSNALAEAAALVVAELIAAEHRATESDLFAALSMDLGDTNGHAQPAADTAAA